MTASFRFSITRQNGPFSAFLIYFVGSKCKRSSLRSQCWMRLFLWFSKTVLYFISCPLLYCSGSGISKISQPNSFACNWSFSHKSCLQRVMTFRKNHEKSCIVTTEPMKNYLLVSLQLVIAYLLYCWETTKMEIISSLLTSDIVAKCM